MTVHLISAAAMLLAVAGSADAATIADGSFESPVVYGGYEYNPIVSGATFIGDAGVEGGTFGFAAAPDGVQDAFLQSTDSSGAEIDLSVTGLVVGNTYSFSYFDTYRSGYGFNPYTVTFDGVTIGSEEPNWTNWVHETTASFVATDTFGTLTFSAPALGGDNDAGIDGVTLTGAPPSGVPEPATWAVMLMGLVGVGAAVRSRRARGVMVA